MTTDVAIHHLALSGVRCAGCVRSLERALKAADVIDDYAVNFAERSVAIQSRAKSDQLVAVIEAAGYGAEPLDAMANSTQQTEAAQTQYRKLVRQSATALAAGALLMVLGMMGLMPDLATIGGRLSAFLIGALTLAIMFYCGRSIYEGGLTSIQRRSLNMDTLISLGTGAAWLYSTGLLLLSLVSPELALLSGGHLYYEATVMILGFILAGQALELRARGQTADAVRALLNLQPEQAWRERDGEWRQVPVELLVSGDRVMIKPGERVSVDAVVSEGNSHVDESMLTGEPLPVSKSAGQQVTGGTLNGAGTLIVEVTQTGSQTVLAQIIATVRAAQNNKPPLGRLADRISAVFVPVVIAVACLASFIWLLIGPSPTPAYALMVLMAVLIVACPCALGLATPMSVMVGVGRAARSGILVRNGDALQLAGTVTTVLLDKTGTLTEGKPAVVFEQLLPASVEDSELRRLIASVESRSEHPLAAAIVDWLGDGELADVEQFSAEAGAGVAATVAGHQLLIGNRLWLEQQHVDCSALDKCAAEQGRQGRSLAWVSLDGQLVAVFAISDRLRADAVRAVEAMKRQGLNVAMLSGDNELSAGAVARQLGISEWYANVRPEGKQAVVQRLQEQGEVVAMVGDGINDAPALVQADVGFAMGNGTDIAIESADVVLMRSEPSLVLEAVLLSRATVQNIRQNLFGAFLYNSLAIPVAAGLLFPFTGLMLNPVIAGAAMAASSVTVVSNANRLRWKALS